MSSADLDRAWEDLVAWVEWLRSTYTQWVRLPPCWPEHADLRAELLAFRHWHYDAFNRARNPVEAVTWHQHLRQSAEAWRELAACEHQPPLRYEIREAGNRARAVAEHVRLAKGRPFFEPPSPLVEKPDGAV